MANKKKGEIVPSNSLVQDEVTGFEGIVIFRIEYMNECIRYAVQPKINSEGKTIIMATHNLDVIKKYKKRIIHLVDGKVSKA